MTKELRDNKVSFLSRPSTHMHHSKIGLMPRERIGNEGIHAVKTGREEVDISGLVWDSSHVIMISPFDLNECLLEWQRDRVRRKTEKHS